MNTIVSWHILAAGHSCVPSACTWGDVGRDYTSAGFVVGLAVLAVIVFAGRAVLRAVRRRRR